VNPYNTLTKLGDVNSLDATLAKRDGTTIALHVKPETFAAETLQGEYANAIGVRTWSVNVSELLNPETGAIQTPEQGDVLTVIGDDGTVRAYSITRGVATGRYWDWLYTRPGYRVKVYTKYEGTELS